MASISDMGAWGESGWSWDFGWNRELFDRDIQRVEELKDLISSFSPRLGIHDSWVWTKKNLACTL